MITNIIPLINESTVLDLVRNLAKDSNNVFIIPHARKNMRKRKITMEQVLRCLLHGAVTEPPHQDIKGNWRMTLEVWTAGRPVSVVPCIEYSGGKQVIVITVFGD